MSEFSTFSSSTGGDKNVESRAVLAEFRNQVALANAQKLIEVSVLM